MNLLHCLEIKAAKSFKKAKIYIKKIGDNELTVINIYAPSFDNQISIK